MVRVQFWGTRGSLAKSGKATHRYGGNTSCVQITSPSGSLVILDCGTGAHDLGQHLLRETQGPKRGSILFSHTHWDHIQGFPFFAPLFVRGWHWDIYGPAGLGRSLRQALSGQMESTYFPVTLEDMGSSIRFHDLVEGSFEIDDLRISTRYLNHPSLTLGYRLEAGRASVVYACDHEPHSRISGNNSVHQLDRRHAQFLAGADLVIHDAQFTDSEYVHRKGWGHSPVEYVSEMCQRAGVRRVALSHHDPGRTDDELDRIVAAVQVDLDTKGSTLEAFAAADGQVVEIKAATNAIPDAAAETFSAHTSLAPALKEAKVIIGVSDQKLATLLEEAARGEGLQVDQITDIDRLEQMATSNPPALIILEDNPPTMDGLAVGRRLRSAGESCLKDVPIVLVGDRERNSGGPTDGSAHWLIAPFSSQYARARIQAWLLRSASRWVSAALPPDEEQRLAVLHGLSILDTQPEERFDRITRLAAEIAEVPIALVSLVDENRQWFKSSVGLDAKETSREVSFCAHSVSNRSPLIVQDTLSDERFADNPLVIGGPRIRFYAGFPLFHPSGHCMGTLCMIDTRPRHFSAATIQQFEHLKGLIQQELNSHWQSALDDATRGE
jgi:phosphoribosyl 1,2-cyclic phosphodiesterase/DNA-binding response OmpR family regulator